MGYRGLLLFLCLFTGTAAADVSVESIMTIVDPVPPSMAGEEERRAVRPGEGRDPDPWQGFNRAVYRFNDTLDRYALKPAAKGYRSVTPRRMRTAFTHFFTNLRAPVIVLNDLLQGKVRNAGNDTARFVVNSTAGIAGFFDIATSIGLAQNDEDFGQTLAVWGMPRGPYIVLPFLGPSTIRDTAGRGVDTYSNPRTHHVSTEANLALTGADTVNFRANLLEMDDIVQGDRYLFVRDLYLQHREFAIKDGKVESDPFLDDDEFEDEGGGEATPSGEQEAVPDAGASGNAAPEGAADRAVPAADPASGEGEQEAGEDSF
jgi:phospholipid-binding lipoprotein MlaA